MIPRCCGYQIVQDVAKASSRRTSSLMFKNFLLNAPFGQITLQLGISFFKHTDSETRKFHRALRDIAFQIYQNDPSYRDYINADCHSPDDIESLHAA